jgi:hypothetical protein
MKKNNPEITHNFNPVKFFNLHEKNRTNLSFYLVSEEPAEPSLFVKTRDSYCTCTRICFDISLFTFFQFILFILKTEKDEKFT